jgi:FkbM family methyltransferase
VLVEALRRLGASWPLRPFLRHPPVERIVSVFLRSTTVRQRARFVLRELPRRRTLARYTLTNGLTVFVRHGTPDVATLDEVFYQRQYELPPAVAAMLTSLGRPPNVLDLGANVGLFGAYVLGRFPGARVTAVEADAANARVLRLCAVENADRGEWDVIEAAASSSDGEVEFASGGFSLSHLVGPGESGVTVPAVDVLPLVGSADLVKMDIEGGEWAILADGRFEAHPPPAIVLEYHPHLCPEPEAQVAAVELLQGAGFETHVFDERAGHGLAWGWRPATQARTASSSSTGTSPTTG